MFAPNARLDTEFQMGVVSLAQIVLTVLSIFFLASNVWRDTHFYPMGLVQLVLMLIAYNAPEIHLPA
jgi:hypothetical protein